MPKYIFDSCTTSENCTRCDIGYILKKYVKPLMQTLTVDVRDYYMKLLTTKCLNTAVMLSIFMLGKEKGISIANYCDTEKTRERHKQNKDDNNSIIQSLRKDILYKNIKTHRYLYYILLTDGKFTFEDPSKPYVFFPGHVFIIEKFPSHNGKTPNYYFYQSYINEYDLEGHVRKNNNTLKLSYEKLQVIVEGLDYIMNVNKWDEKCIEYWKLLTFVDSSYLKDSICKGNFFICTKKAKLYDCLAHIEKYTKEKLEEITPIKDKSKIYGDIHLYDDKQSPLTISQMYSKLKHLYSDVIHRKTLSKTSKNI